MGFHKCTLVCWTIIYHLWYRVLQSSLTTLSLSPLFCLFMPSFLTPDSYQPLIFLWSPFSSVLSLSRVRLSATPWTAALQSSLSITNSQSSPKLMCIESVMPSNHFILCRSLLLPPSIFLSIRVFSNKSVLHIRWPKYWGFSISPSNEYSGSISFRIDWFDLHAVQEKTLKSLLQHHILKLSILWCSAFFMVQLSHPYMIIGKTIALTRRTSAF